MALFCLNYPIGLAGNGQLSAGVQLKNFALSNMIKLIKELHTSMMHSPRPVALSFLLAAGLFVCSAVKH